MFTDETTIENIPVIEEEIYRDAINEYGDTDLRIEDFACDLNGNSLSPEFKSLHYYGNKKSLNDFWNIVNRIKEERGVF